MKPLERLLEAVLWNSRYLIIIPVIASLLISIGVLVVTTADVLHVISSILSYLGSNLDTYARESLRGDVISEVVGVMDGYLLAAILLIFTLGLYELFVNQIDAAEGSVFAGRVLLITSLDDLKDRLAKVILVILIVKFFQSALNLKYETVPDLLLLAAGVLFIGAALYLTGAKPGKKTNKADTDEHA